MSECKSKRHKLSGYLNAAFLFFFFWYFFIHVGVDGYYRKYISHKETFLDDVYYTAKVASYAELNERLARTKTYDVFVGDSLIEQFPVTELFPGRAVLNRGIGQDTSAGIFRRLEHNVNNVKIARLFLMVGHNDLKYRSVEDASNNIKKIMINARADKKYFFSILPCADAQYNDDIMRLNAKIKEASQRNAFLYIDCYHLFLAPNGSVASQYYYDGTHLNTTGYLKLKKLIESTIDL